MKINIKTYQDVEICELEVKKIVKKFICDTFEIPGNAFVKDGDLMENVECHSSHSWTKEERIRKASEIDKAAILILNKL